MAHDGPDDLIAITIGVRLHPVQIIARVLDCEHLASDVGNSATGEIREQHLSASKAHETLGWKPEYSLEQGRHETVEWYRTYLS